MTYVTAGSEVGGLIRNMSRPATTDVTDLPVRTEWFASAELADDVTRIVEPSVNPFLRSNIWHVPGRDRDLVVDTGMGIGDLRSAFPALFEREPLVFVTHGHYDHTGGAHEFSDRWSHSSEASMMAHPEIATLVTDELSDSFAKALAAGSPAGAAPTFLIDAIPYPGYDVISYRTVAAPSTTLAEDGDAVSLGDRSFEVIHLPGHTPGSAGLFEHDTGMLFTGDVLYDGDLLDELPESNIEAYVESMRRLLTLPVTVVHAGHEDSFGAERLSALVEDYLRLRA